MFVIVQERFRSNENEKEKLMKRITSTLFLSLALLVASVANAQMMGGGNHNGSGGTPSNGQNGGMNGMNGGMGDMAGMGEHRGLIVGADGTVYTVRVSNPTTTASQATFEVVAVRSSGAIGWTASVNAGMTFIEISGSHLLVTTSPHGFDMGEQSPTSLSSTLVALSTASGLQQWTLQLDGFAFDIEPFAGGTYVTVVKPAQSSNSNGGMHGGGNGTVSYGTRTLIAVGTDGKVLWSVPLNN